MRIRRAAIILNFKPDARHPAVISSEAADTFRCVSDARVGVIAWVGVNHHTGSEPMSVKRNEMDVLKKAADSSWNAYNRYGTTDEFQLIIHAGTLWCHGHNWPPDECWKNRERSVYEQAELVLRMRGQR